jgi:hypothetical protein
LPTRSQRGKRRKLKGSAKPGRTSPPVITDTLTHTNITTEQLDSKPADEEEEEVEHADHVDEDAESHDLRQESDHSPSDSKMGVVRGKKTYNR